MSQPDPRSQSPLFTPLQVGPYQLRNRIVKSPMSRMRAAADDMPTALMAEYYGQRAGAGLVITESVQISRQGKGYRNSPGIYSAEQVQAWAGIVKRVHAGGSVIFMQLWHCGRMSHPDLQENGAQPVAPSAIRPNGEVYTDTGPQAVPEPRALTTEEIPGIIEQYVQAAVRAKAAGFDGIEVHAGNGFLLDQFLRDGTNQRSDRYGGSVENRTRLLLEIVEALIPVWGADKIGVKMSPLSTYGDIRDSNPQALYTHLVEQLNRYGLAYLHFAEGELLQTRDVPGLDFRKLRGLFYGPVIGNNGYDFAQADEAVASDKVDMIAFARLFAANPDLVERFRLGAELNPLDMNTLQGGGAEGYTDYPTLAQSRDMASA
ncbi:alkene reductase [Pseudomonas sp. NPDC090202]|uniref:alkene reductase n=1 Tax=unclassified Pseudomonas TaxID=196821 RepID=UPI00381C1B8D